MLFAYLWTMMDVIIIGAKLVCLLCFVCKLNYLFGAHMRYGGVTITFQHQWLLCLAFNRGMYVVTYTIFCLAFNLIPHKKM